MKNLLVGSEKQVAWATDIVSKAEAAWSTAKGLVKPEMQPKLAALETSYFAKIQAKCTRGDGKVHAEDVIAQKLFFPTDADNLKANMSHFCA
jgi:hypothetical protein